MTAGAADAADAAPILVVHRLRVRYGDMVAVDGIDLEVAPGEAVALDGPNGAGKTSVLRAIAGLTPAAAGTVTVAGQDVTTAPASRRHDLGVGYVAGGHGIFAGLSVLDNLLAACHRFAWDRARVRARIGAAVDHFPLLLDHLTQRAGSLSGGEQQMLTLTLGLLAEPRVLLIDELTLGVAAGLLDVFVGVVADQVERGTAVVAVDQSGRISSGVARRTVRMESGVERSTVGSPPESAGSAPGGPLSPSVGRSDPTGGTR